MRSLFRQPESQPFHDKVWRRADMPLWDTRWHSLSLPARRFLIDTVKTGPYHRPERPVNSMSSVARDVFDQLLREKFIQTQDSGFVVAEGAAAFLNRVRSLRRLALLDEQQMSQLDRYVGQVFATYDLNRALAEIVDSETGIGLYASGNLIELYVCRHFWPEWVVEHIQNAQAGPLLEAIEKAGRVCVANLPNLMPEQHPAAVRGAFDQMVNYLALVEDIDAQTLDIVTGLLPAVRLDQMKRRLRKLIPLEPVQPTEAGPEAGIDVPDLRAALLEISAIRPRLKQDRSLFAKERERFLAALDPLPDWMPFSSETRLEKAMQWANRLGMVHAVKAADKSEVLGLTKAGQSWQALGREEQHAQLFADLRDGKSRMYNFTSEDEAFLGTMVRVRRTSDMGVTLNLKAEIARLREAVDGLLSQLPLRTFHVLDQFLAWAGELSRNPLLLGGSIASVRVFVGGRIVPPLEEFIDDACRTLFRNLIMKRLAPLGCVQLGRDERGQLLFARLPLLDAYFGREVEASPETSMVTRVIVQPDFSVMVIGLDPAPVAELMPFCDRVQGSATQGALTFRISRESVFRGIASGLPPEDILARLKKHASLAIPQNVMTELEGWCGQTRRVSLSQTTLIRCPDADTASRVVSALGKLVERVGEQAVALEGDLTPALRQKLQGQGVLVEETQQFRHKRSKRSR